METVRLSYHPLVTVFLPPERSTSLEAKAELNIRLLWSFNPFRGEKTFSVEREFSFSLLLLRPPARKNFALRLCRRKSKYERKVSTLEGPEGES